jgi:hypothetical protein
VRSDEEEDDKEVEDEDEDKEELTRGEMGEKEE